MNFCLLGATGRVGSVILESALSQHHFVHVVVRDRNKLTIDHPNLQVIEGNALNEKDLAEALKGTNAVISALNTDGSTTLSNATPIIVNQMKMQGIQRIITIGTAGILQARSNPRIYRFQAAESKRKTTKDAEEHLKAYITLKDSGLDWTIVCPTYLPTGERMGVYRYEKNYLPLNPSSISIYDTADFAYKQLESREFIRERVGLTY
ncbi:NAD(P)-dependent oxidoreductase [Bacillus sp. EB600]|uniref:NAD(P)-dependent oxidoreductase n=1 Tax=Bacillus sp. EB600 TaxID=2806345 RepID=UPI00210E7A47|nr:NAD(P)H-binding protein [Bacillus sp. EB600]MCQ6280689.1 NAD(P)H-binding protein [Bacillus sp. EB600]